MGAGGQSAPVPKGTAGTAGVDTSDAGATIPSGAGGDAGATAGSGASPLTGAAGAKVARETGGDVIGHGCGCETAGGSPRSVLVTMGLAGLLAVVRPGRRQRRKGRGRRPPRAPALRQP